MFLPFGRPPHKRAAPTSVPDTNAEPICATASEIVAWRTSPRWPTPCTTAIGAWADSAPIASSNSAMPRLLGALRPGSATGTVYSTRWRAASESILFFCICAVRQCCHVRCNMFFARLLRGTNQSEILDASKKRNTQVGGGYPTSSALARAVVHGCCAPRHHRALVCIGLRIPHPLRAHMAQTC